MDSPIATLRYHEPPGVIHITEEIICRHLIAIGQTGSGKTTGLVNPLLQQLIGRKPSIGLLVIDGKGDNTVDKVREYARQAGRERDVLVLSESSHSFYDFFGGIQLSSLDEYTTKALYGSRGMGEQNIFWEESRYGLIQCGLVLLVSGGPFDFNTAANFLREFCFQRNSKLVADRVEFVERLLRRDELRPSTRQRLQLAVDEARNWRNLDDRSRELHRSTLSQAWRPLWSPTARDLFDSSRGTRFDPGAVVLGKIMVCSINSSASAANSQLASLVFRAIKRDYYKAVLSRPEASPGRGVLAGIVLDELQLAISSDDADCLPLLRSKAGFMLSAVQSLSSLDEILGRRRRDALMSNFGSCCFFNSRENQTDELAMLTLGTKDRPKDRPKDKAEFSVIPVIDPSQSLLHELVCPPGLLARLRPHEALLKLAGGLITQHPVWMEPLFHQSPPTPIAPRSDDLAAAVANLQRFEANDKVETAGPALLFKHMHLCRHKLKATEATVAATWQLCSTRSSRAEMLQFAREHHQIQGLDLLPACWLAGFLHWLRRNPNLAPAVAGVSTQGGVLWARLNPPSSWDAGTIMSIAAEVNLMVYPSLWRPLLRRHWIQLYCERPDLRPELVSLPQAASLNLSQSGNLTV